MLEAAEGHTQCDTIVTSVKPQNSTVLIVVHTMESEERWNDEHFQPRLFLRMENGESTRVGETA